MYNCTGVNTQGYDVFKFTIRKALDGLIPRSLGLTYSNGMLSLYFTDESGEVIDPKTLQDVDIDVIIANTNTAKTIYSSTQKGIVSSISTKGWEAGIYAVRVTIGDQQLTNKILINP